MSLVPSASRRPVLLDLAASLGVALVVLGPLLLGSGLWLVGDMVFVPRQPWKSSWLGLDASLPRAVPMDALVSLATLVVPGAVVQKVLLVGGFVAGGLGIGRLLAGHAWCARTAAIVALCWNPWVYERLLIGQWAILVGYLLLPWVAVAALRLRRDPRAWPLAGVVLVLSAVCSPSSGVMAVLVLGVLALGRDRRGWWRVALLGLLANLTWAVPALTADAVRISTDGVFAGFAARGESAAGVAPSLLSMGGIWKTSILPAERESAAVVLLACLLSLAALVALRRRHDDRARWFALGAGAFVVALVPALPGGSALLEAVADVVPGTALLRDSHRFLAPLGLVLAVGAAELVALLRSRIGPRTGALWSAVVLGVLAPVLLLPSLAWGAAGELQRSSYPQGWQAVAELVGDDDVTVVLPWAGSYRGFDWNHRRAVLDPAPRLVPGTVLVDDAVRLDDRVVPAEDPRTAEVGAALDAGGPAEVAEALAALGVRWVLLEEGMGDLEAPAGQVRHDGDGLVLVELAGPASEAEPLSHRTSAGRQILVTIGHTMAILLISLSSVWILRAGSNGRHTP